MKTTQHTPFKCWLWPNHVVSKRDSGALREQYNALVNSHAELLEACKALHKRFITESMSLPDDDEFLALERASMAAIAKAEGKE